MTADKDDSDSDQHIDREHPERSWKPNDAWNEDCKTRQQRDATQHEGIPNGLLTVETSAFATTKDCRHDHREHNGAATHYGPVVRRTELHDTIIALPSQRQVSGVYAIRWSSPRASHPTGRGRALDA